MNPSTSRHVSCTALAALLACAATASAQTTATYTGPATLGNTNTWMTPANWSSGAVPAGAVNVVVPDTKGVVAWDDAIPAYTGNLTLGITATLQMGFTTTRTASYNALGKPGTTLITMAEGSHIFCRTTGSFIMPEILLTGNGMVSLGASTTKPAECVFNYPINGSFQFTLGTNADGGGVKLNAPNTFTSMVIQGIGGRGKSMYPFAANVPGALGLGDVTSIGASPSTADYRCPQIQFNATEVMRVTSKLILNGKGPSGNGNDRILMNQSATIGGLVIDDVAMAPGTYTTSETWLDGPGTLTVLLISPLFPDPAFGKVLPPGDVNLTWTNEAPTTGTDVWCDVWFGTDPASLTQVATKQLNLTSFTVNAPTVSTYYWRVDSYLGGTSSGTPKTGGVYHFVVNDSDGDGMPDEWEMLYTSPSSPTALQPDLDADSDSLTNLREYQSGTIPTNPDTDADGVLDGHETKTGIWVSATNTGTDPLDDDSDGDSLLDGYETKTGSWVSATDTGTDPNYWDSDRDALSDTVETNTGTLIDKTNTGTNPNLPDTDSDGAGDWYEVYATFTDPNLDSSTPGIPYPLPDPDSSTGATNKPVKVYIMSGQSNMVGMGTVYGTGDGTLETMTLRQNKFPNLVDAAGAWTQRQDVLYRGVITALGNKPLAAGCGASSSNLGPELGFGQIMGWYHDEPVLLLKSSDGNRALSWDILPPGSPSWVYGTTNYSGYGFPIPTTPGDWYAGREFDHFFMHESEWAHPDTANTNVVDVLDNFATQYPQWAAQGFEIAGFVWWQGEKDTLNTGYAATYEEHLVTLITKLREYYTNRYPGKVVPNAPFVLGTLGEASLSMTTPEAEVAVRDAHLAVDGDFGRYPQFAGNVKTVYTHPLSEGGTGNGHYDGRAGTYMLVGDAMGRAMLDLQDDETPPNPNPMTFEIAPQGAGSGSIGMKASAASDQSLPVQYYFENTTNGHFRNWSTSREWTNTGLTDGAIYSYRVKARDGNNLEGQWSAELSATAGADATAPTPNPMTFAVPPNALGETSITMTATTAIDLTAVQYYFTCTAGGGPDSGWQSATVFTPTGLAHSTSYSYTVTARDAALNQTAASATASATTTTPDLIPPTPNPMTFASPPASAGITSITMTATTASDPGDVEYFFDCTGGGGPDSGWQSATMFTPTGLAPGTTYTYTVMARDKSPAQNTTTASAPASATTAVPDTTPPSPDPMTFASPPSALGQTSIGMTATTATDPSGVEYFFECTAGGGHSSAWQDSPAYTDTDLTGTTQYTYRVRARDKSAAQTATAWSAEASATTPTAPKTLYSSGNKPWNTTAANWGLVTAGPYDTATWSSGDSAIFEGTAGTVTLGEAISIKNLTFSNTTGTYTITGSALNFTSGTITGSVPLTGNGGVAAIIRSNITGSPAINLKPMDGDEQFTLNPVNDGSMSIGAVTGDGGTGSEKLNLQGGAGSSGTIASVSGPKLIVTAGAWTLNGGSYAYGNSITGGTLTLNANLNSTNRSVTLGGTGVINYNVANAVSATAATAASGSDNGFRLQTGATLDQTSGAAINTSTTNPSMTWEGNWTFIGTNGANSNLNLGTGNVFLKAANPQVSVTNAATTLTVGGVIANDATPGRSLTKAGPGTLELRGANTYTGATTVNAGTLKMGANNVIPNASNVTIGTATLDANTRTDTAGTLDVTGTAVINLGSGAALAFADSKAVDWTGGTLNVTGTLGATSLRFGDSADDLTGGQLAKISVNGSGLGTYILDSNGYLVATSTNPFETWAGAGGAFDADANNDGVDNGMAWVLGAANPSTNAIALLPTMDNTTDQNFFIFTYRRDDDANADPKTTIKLEYGSTLAAWTTAVAGPDIIITPTNDFYAAGIDKVEVKIRRTLAVDGKLFARLSAVNTP